METEKSGENRSVRDTRNRLRTRRYTFDEKLKAVRLHVQEGFAQTLVSQETGVSISSLADWVRAYREQGEAGLRRKSSPQQGRRLPSAVAEKILELKRQHRWYGVKKIADALRRWFFLEASPETVRKTLHAAHLMDPPAKARRNLTRPRFFERATPNQMWQSDLFTFRLGGKYAYAVAFMDDYSRYVVGFGLYRSPTAEAVIETYRIAVGEYSPPKEMLTDRGRQYTSWRGKSRFAAELTKDRVAHLVSRPQHPMTLGKVERFWATLWQEFLVRAQFDSFESARERLRLWVKYYNHRRPHQGIGGLCPADRYFEIQNELKKTVQHGIQENLLELALRGQPKAPFYLVGRMDGQSVVLKAEKGKLKLSVNEQELTYDLEKGSDRAEDETQTAEAGERAGDGGGESAGGAGDLDGAGEAGGSDAGDERELRDAPAVAGTGDGGDAPGAGKPGEPGGWRGVVAALAGALAEAPANGRPGKADGPAGAVAGGCAPGAGRLESLNHADETGGPGPGGSDPEGAHRPADREGGRGAFGGLAENLLRVGGARAGSDAAPVGGPESGAAGDGDLADRGGASGESRGAGGEAGGGRTDRGDPGGPAGDGGNGH
jgi:transposase InsO family protein